MDTLRDKQHLNALWESGAAPWNSGKDSESRPVAACRSCGGVLTVTMADLGMQPHRTLSSYVDQTNFGASSAILACQGCERCKLVQLDYDVAREECSATMSIFIVFGGLAGPCERVLRHGAPGFA